MTCLMEVRKAAMREERAQKAIPYTTFARSRSQLRAAAREVTVMCGKFVVADM